MIDVVNLQRKVKIDLASVRKYIKEIEAKVDEMNGRTFSVAFVSDDRMKDLNSTFRGKDSTTDVLSFPMSEPQSEPGAVATGFSESSDPKNPVATAPGSDFLGDIVISAHRAERQARENKLTFEREIQQLILHGVLHLCGYNHETDSGEMNARELELRDRLKIS